MKGGDKDAFRHECAFVLKCYLTFLDVSHDVCDCATCVDGKDVILPAECVQIERCTEDLDTDGQLWLLPGMNHVGGARTLAHRDHSQLVPDRASFRGGEEMVLVVTLLISDQSVRGVGGEG